MQPPATSYLAKCSLLHKAWGWGRTLESEDKPEGLVMPERRSVGEPELFLDPGESWRYSTGLGGIRAGVTLSVVEKEEQRNFHTHTPHGSGRGSKEKPRTQEGELCRSVSQVRRLEGDGEEGAAYPRAFKG